MISQGQARKMKVILRRIRRNKNSCFSMIDSLSKSSQGHVTRLLGPLWPCDLMPLWPFRPLRPFKIWNKLTTTSCQCQLVEKAYETSLNSSCKSLATILSLRDGRVWGRGGVARKWSGKFESWVAVGWCGADLLSLSHHDFQFRIFLTMVLPSFVSGEICLSLVFILLLII